MSRRALQYLSQREETTLRGSSTYHDPAQCTMPFKLLHMAWLLVLSGATSAAAKLSPPYALVLSRMSLALTVFARPLRRKGS